MSGDVQPRKRKDKKKKKDELGLEEPRGTAAALGEGDVFMHSYSDHGTGGHWCAKVIFFSLLAVLVGLIGLIILENRGLSELEANSVQSQYSNILEGWLEDAPDDDHHDEHTLELKHHHDDEEDEHDSQDPDEEDHDEEEHGGEDEHADEEYTQEDEDGQNEEDSQQDLEDAEDEDEDDRSPYKYYAQDEEDEDETKENPDEQEDEDEENKQYKDDEQQQDEDDVQENDDEDEQDNDDEDGQASEQDEGEDNDDRNDENESNEQFDNEDEYDEERDVEGDNDEDDEQNDEDQNREDEDEHDEDHDDADDEVEVEKIEKEASEEEDPIISDLPALPEEDDDDKDDGKDDGKSAEPDNNYDADNNEDTADDDFLEADDIPPVVARVSAPAGKPFVEVEEDDDVLSENPKDMLEEEEEYEKLQEELRKEEEQSSHHMWLKVTVGCALLVATHAVVRRATAPRDEPEERVEREETPVVDRRMTLIPERPETPVVPKIVSQEYKKPVVKEVREEAPVRKAPVVIKQESEDEQPDEPELEEVVEEEEVEEEEEPEKIEIPKKAAGKEVISKELYSDEDEEEEEEVIQPKKEVAKTAEPLKSELEPEDEVPDDVEIIEDEQVEEELEEEEEGTDVSDVDDTELLSRLEAKYGRLPEPERPTQKHKDGGDSVEDMWPGEPADAYWRQQLDSAERELRQGEWSAAMKRASVDKLRGSARARFIVATGLDRMAEARRDNGLLSRAIDAYFELLKMSDKLSNKKLLQVARRLLDRIQFRGNYLKAEPVYRLLIRRFPDEPAYRNNMTISFLMANRNDLAENVLKETLALWPKDRVALAHYGFILKTSHKDKLEEAVELFKMALEGDEGPACEPRFYYHYGDALLLLGRFKEAHEVHKRAAKMGHFLSPAQRSLYNVPRLKSRPWWDIEQTPYAKFARNLEGRWKDILKEGQKAASLYKEEAEGLRERGQWSQMDLFVRGRELPGRCARAPVTCALVKSEPAAVGCTRGQVKFSSMSAGTHVRPHVGPTNCRLRLHLGLSNTNNTFIRVDQETRQWEEGKVLLFDDSFEHEVWHNGTGPRLVLIIDLWHPDLTATERRTLPPI